MRSSFAIALTITLLGLSGGSATAQVPIFDETRVDGQPILEPPGGRPIEPIEIEGPAEDFEDLRPQDLPTIPAPPTPPDEFLLPDATFTPQPNPQLPPQPPRQPLPSAVNLPGETAYTLDGGDVLQINVFDVPEYSGQYIVAVDGTINMPLLGALNIRGQTVAEVNNRLSELYRAYLVRPFVNSTLIAMRSLNFAIAGEVARPGSYISTAPGTTRQFPTIIQALELADGVTLLADLRNVELRRRHRGVEQRYQVNLWEFVQNGDIRQNVTLRDGDSIFVPTAPVVDPLDLQVLLKASFAPDVIAPVAVAITGEVSSPGNYFVEPGGLTGVPFPATLTDALAEAGGIKPSADIGNIIVQRRDRQGQLRSLDINLWAFLREGDVSQNIPLQPNDAILIPKADELTSAEIVALTTTSFSPDEIRVAVIGEVISPGRLALPPGTSLNQGIAAAGGFNKVRAKRASVELLRLNPDGSVSNREIPVDLNLALNAEDNPLLRNGDVIVVNRNGLTGFSDVLGSVLTPVGNAFNALNFLRLFGLFQN